MPIHNTASLFQCCGSGMFIPDPNFFHPGSRIRIKEFKFSTQKIVHKLTEIWSGLFIPDPDPDFYPSRIQGSKRHRTIRMPFHLSSNAYRAWAWTERKRTCFRWMMQFLCIFPFHSAAGCARASITRPAWAWRRRTNASSAPAASARCRSGPWPAAGWAAAARWRRRPDRRTGPAVWRSLRPMRAHPSPALSPGIATGKVGKKEREYRLSWTENSRSASESLCFWPPRSVRHKYGSGSGSFPFLIKVLRGLKYWLQNKIFIRKCSC